MLCPFTTIEINYFATWLTSTAVTLLFDLCKLAGNVGSVAIQYRCISIGDLTGVVQDNDLGGEVSSTSWWAVLGVSSDIATTQLLH